MERNIEERSCHHQFRSCLSCGSLDGLEITFLQEQGDAVFCQVCGAEYVIQSLVPLKLHSSVKAHPQIH